MIVVMKPNGEEFMLNSDHIETVEAHPHTVIKLTNGEKLLVRESPEEILEKIVEFRRRLVVVPEGSVTSLSEVKEHKQAGKPVGEGC